MVTEDDLKPIKWSNEPNGYCQFPHLHGTIGDYKIMAVEYDEWNVSLFVSKTDATEHGNVISTPLISIHHAPAVVRKELANYINSFLK